MKTAEVIRQRIENLPAGEPFASARFFEHGTRTAVDKALSRLVQSGTLMRVAQGVYARPLRSPWVPGPVPPPLEKVLETIAARTGETLQVSGAKAANMLHLSSQVPMRPVYYTSGLTRKLRVGAAIVTLKHVSPRKLMFAGRPAGAAVSALWYLGPREVNADVIGQIRQAIAPEEFEALRSAVPRMPAWMAKAVLKQERGTQRG